MMIRLTFVGQDDCIFSGKTPSTPTVIIKKTDDSGAPLKGAKFTVNKVVNGVVQDAVFASGTTNSQGQITIKTCKRGETYYVKETKRPKGYAALGDTEKTFTINQLTTVLEFKNYDGTEDLSLSIIKENPLTEEPVERS